MKIKDTTTTGTGQGFTRSRWSRRFGLDLKALGKRRAKNRSR